MHDVRQRNPPSPDTTGGASPYKLTNRGPSLSEVAGNGFRLRALSYGGQVASNAPYGAAASGVNIWLTTATIVDIL
jgi:hypothetical protein